jgi:CBASS immunity sensor of nucleotide second messenger signals/Cap4-like dsDNA endonuclease family protein
MSDAPKKTDQSPEYPGSLLSPQAMGGINAGKGFDFQTRFAACRIPVWLLEAAFRQLLFEGTGDIDVRFTENGKSSRIHIQVKDHDVQPAELRDVIEQFHRMDAELPDTYKCFTLVCPSLSATIRSIETGLARLRGARAFYDDKPEALAPTKQALDGRLRDAGLGDYIDFIHAKVHFDIGHGDMHHDERALGQFVNHLLSHPDYAERVRAVVLPAFAETLRLIGARKGSVIERSEIEKLIQDAIATGVAGEKKVTLWLQNWTSETFDVPADYALDWSQHFDRATRKVPPPETWSNQLLPELYALKKKMLSERKERLVRFRGKCTLSTGVALGAVFPTVGGWAFELPQPPAKEDWRSDALATTPYEPITEIIESSPDGADIVLGLNVRGDGRQDIVTYIENTGNLPRAFVFISPPSQGAQSIRGAGDAVAFAQAVREHLGGLLKKYDLRKTRMFVYGPFALAVFLGQQLTSIGEVQLFEYQDPGYVPSCSIKT